MGKITISNDFTGIQTQLAMTKADYDKFVEEKGRTPGDAKWNVPSRGQHGPDLEYHDPSVRTDTKAKRSQAARDSRYKAKQKEKN